MRQWQRVQVERLKVRKYLSKQGESVKGFSILSSIVGLAVLGCASASVLAQSRSSPTDQQILEGRSQTVAQQSKSGLITWREFVARGGRRFLNRNYDLPREFNNGYLYINSGASSYIAYILKQGLSSYPPIKSDITQIDYDLGDRYVKSGKAIRFYWGSGTYYERNHKVRVEKPGEECLEFTCLEAPFMTKQEINRILRSERRIR
ncbi:MAG: hypothetical protein HC789_15585 [Microcoleus sp. CSU_2_2]|nr:hypothetical protein [Microcoleus sp. SU_5_3]NJS11686.1 hypothetical protein [Microcoleus sp. CSU_2_2]